MATFSGSYVPIDSHSNARVNSIVDNMLTPRLLSFRQITIHDEQATKCGSNSWKVSYPNWNEAYPYKVNLNGRCIDTSTDVSSVDYILGEVTLSNTYQDGDIVEITYNIDWFPVGVLAGYLYQSVDIINNSGQAASPTSYTLDTAPSNWDGVLADMAFALCMEKLLLDYDLWYGRLIFSIGEEELHSGGGDIVGQLETLKANAEERAKISLDNEKFKISNYLAQPTGVYYSAVRGGAGRAYSGKLRGWKNNRYT
jgi:hypothetical protein